MDQRSGQDPCTGGLTFLERSRTSSTMWRCACGSVVADPRDAVEHVQPVRDAG